MSLKLHPSPRNPVLGEEDQPAEGIMAPFEGSDEGDDVLKLLGLPSQSLDDGRARFAFWR